MVRDGSETGHGVREVSEDLERNQRRMAGMLRPVGWLVVTEAGYILHSGYFNGTVYRKIRERRTKYTYRVGQKKCDDFEVTWRRCFFNER